MLKKSKSSYHPGELNGTCGILYFRGGLYPGDRLYPGGGLNPCIEECCGSGGRLNPWTAGGNGGTESSKLLSLGLVEISSFCFCNNTLFETS